MVDADVASRMAPDDCHRLGKLDLGDDFPVRLKRLSRPLGTGGGVPAASAGAVDALHTLGGPRDLAAPRRIRSACPRPELHARIAFDCDAVLGGALVAAKGQTLDSVARSSTMRRESGVSWKHLRFIMPSISSTHYSTESRSVQSTRS